MRSFNDTLDIRITDSTLRDGSHAVAHQFTEAQVRDVVRELDEAGVPVIEVAHGDGLGGSSYVYGRSGTDELMLIRAAVEEARQARIAALMLPGVGTIDDIKAVHDLGVSVIRVATHCSEADISEQHFGLARDMGLETVGFLMLAHRLSPEELAKQARIMVDAGCQCVYVTDSAGALILDEVTDRVEALLAEIGGEAQIGFHGHQNLSLAVANTAFAFRAGAVQVDGCARGLGAGAGNTPTEALVAVCDKLGLKTGIDTFAMMRVAEEVVRPIMSQECVVDRLSLAMGYGGVYSSFMKHAARAAERYGVDPAAILLRCGERKLVGGQEDQLMAIALELVEEKAGA
jgi:4-hydroxy 2-oxovalerate aldolase